MYYFRFLVYYLHKYSYDLWSICIWNEIVNRLWMCQIKQPMQQSSKYGRRCNNSEHSNTIKHIHTIATNHPDIQLLIRMTAGTRKRVRRNNLKKCRINLQYLAIIIIMIYDEIKGQKLVSFLSYQVILKMWKKEERRIKII